MHMTAQASNQGTTKYLIITPLSQAITITSRIASWGITLGMLSPYLRRKSTFHSTLTCTHKRNLLYKISLLTMAMVLFVQKIPSTE